MQSIEGRRKLDFCKILWKTGTIFGAEVSDIYRKHKSTVSYFKMNGNHCFNDFEFVLNE